MHKRLSHLLGLEVWDLIMLKEPNVFSETPSLQLFSAMDNMERPFQQPLLTSFDSKPGEHFQPSDSAPAVALLLHRIDLAIPTFSSEASSRRSMPKVPVLLQ